MSAVARAIEDFAARHSGLLPTTLEQLAQEGYVSQETLRCPATQQKSQDETSRGMKESYIYLGQGHSSQDFNADMPLVVERPGHHFPGIIHVIYGDLHVEWLSGEEAQRLYEQVEKQVDLSEAK